ncbi:MAG TPA: ROK family protein [Candidatus Dormibacteraeota bacterium]|nr:ROK family protein [Candidatus Dormibacteraeota bacterium]
MDTPGPFLLGVDIGGTKVAAGLVDAEGSILFQTRVPMIANGDAAEGFGAFVRAIHAVFDAKPEMRSLIAGIGVCAPGPLDPHTGVVINPPNVTCWRNFPLAAETRLYFNLPTYVDNDANAAALAEAIWGAGIGYRNVFYATLGTGIGSGIIFDRQIYHGRTGSAAEGGHITIDYHGPRCGCGKRGCIEALCSGPAIAKRAQERLAESKQTSSKMLALAGGNIDLVKAEIVGEAFRQGDALAAGVLQNTAELLTVWIGNVIDLLEPEVIIFGGGIANLMSPFFGQIREQLPKWSINQRCTEIPLLMAKYGSDAGIVGGAALCRAG